MEKIFNKLLNGYQKFREKYATDNQSIMEHLHQHGQKPEVMIVACCDSRVDPALILQCDPGDLFVVRNVASIIPPYEKDNFHHGTSAALEFGIRFLKVKHLIILGHSQCGGMQSLLTQQFQSQEESDFIINWVSIVKSENTNLTVDDYMKQALDKSYQNCLTFPWINEKIERQELKIHLWFF